MREQSKKNLNENETGQSIVLMNETQNKTSVVVSRCFIQSMEKSVPNGRWLPGNQQMQKLRFDSISSLRF